MQVGHAEVSPGVEAWRQSTIIWILGVGAEDQSLMSQFGHSNEMQNVLPSVHQVNATIRASFFVLNDGSNRVATVEAETPWAS